MKVVVFLLPGGTDALHARQVLQFVSKKGARSKIGENALKNVSPPDEHLDPGKRRNRSVDLALGVALVQQLREKLAFLGVFGSHSAEDDAVFAAQIEHYRSRKGFFSKI